eukprot:8085974-Pyramimonas_sp.AAC.2
MGILIPDVVLITNTERSAGLKFSHTDTPACDGRQEASQTDQDSVGLEVLRVTGDRRHQRGIRIHFDW